MPEYINAPNCSVLFNVDGVNHENDAEGIVLGLRGRIAKPAHFYDGGEDSSGTTHRYVFWGQLSGTISMSELIFEHSAATASDPDLTTSDVLPTSGGFSSTVKYGGSIVGQYSTCTALETGPGIVTMGGDVYYQGTTSIRVWDPDISAS